ncbi:replicative DNA helicase [Micromonospora zamorensis]|uniref:replicative DNA helicase n=1 Tax=Micromonospora zamorensis TaxID=709883 RepID=UPI00340976A8
MEGGPVSVTDDMRAESRSGGGQPPAPRDGHFDKTPPQDVAAEQCVLGGMLLSKDAIADVVEILKTNDFYRPVHATIFDIILDIYGRGEPADSITVAAALADSGDLVRIGGAPYLHTLIASVPTAANAAYYARIVSERAVLRRLVEAGTKIVQLGYGTASGGSRDVDDVVDLAQQAVYDVTERRVSEDFAILADMLQPTLDEIEAVGATGGMMTGVPTGFSDLDRLLNGLHAGQLIIVAGRPGLGKALALDTPLPTPDGWTTMGEVKAGDQLLAADGRPTTVTHAFDVMHDRPCYEVEFSDGTVIVADAEHLWKTTTRAGRRQEPARRRRHWPESSLANVRAAHERLSAQRNQPITLFDTIEPVGPEFRHVLHTVAHEVGSVGRISRPIVPNGKPQNWTAPGYPAGPLPSALLERAEREVNAGSRADHDGVVTTAEIAASLRTDTAQRRLNHAVRNCAPIQLPDRELLVPPYTLGAWLGDGHSDASRFTTADPEMVTHVEADGFVVRPSGPMVYTILLQPTSAAPQNGSFLGLLRQVGVAGNKHIPGVYLRASEAQRRALLAGLMDTDGTVAPSGNLQYTSTSKRLADDVRELIVSLGYRCTVNAKPERGRTRESSIAYTLNFSTPDVIFRLGRKRDAHAARRRTTSDVRTTSRFIVDVRPVPSAPVRCVTVDNDEHLYLASRAMIPTHNSTASMDFARHAAIRANQAAAIFSLEMSKVEIVMRLLSAEARVPLHVLRSGQLSDDDWTKLARCMGEISEAPLFVDDTPSMNLMEIRAKARRLKQRHDLKMIVVDYLQLMTSPKRTESRQQEVADLSRGLKLLAKEVECPVIAVSQLNRGPEQRTDKRPQLSDLRESGSIEQDADVVILLHRDDYYDKESPRAGEADFIIAKHRNGPTDTVTVAAQLHLSRFVDMAIG